MRMHMRRHELALLFGLIIAVIISPMAAFAGDCVEVRGQVLRMHILADSNSDIDQQHKLAVRNALLGESEKLFPEQTNSAQEAVEVAEQNLTAIEQIATQTLRERGCEMPVSAQVTHMYFDTRVYDGIVMPAGMYDAIQVTIGSGQGQNWWCVMYPPLCLPAAEKDDSEGLIATPESEKTEDIHALNKSPNYKMGFATVELWEALGQGVQEIFGTKS